MRTVREAESGKEIDSSLTRDSIYRRRGWKIPLAYRALSGFTWIPLFILAVVLLSVSLLPSLYLIRWAFSIFDGLTSSGLLDLLFLTSMFGCAYILFGISLMLFSGILKRFIHIFTGIKEGSYPYLSPQAGYWSIVNGIIIFNRQFFLELTRTTTLLVIFYRMMGMKIGKRTLINSSYIYDPDMVELGRDVTIGGDAMILGHVGEKGVLRFKKTVIEDGADIGQSSMIMPGVVVGRGSVVGAMSIVVKDTMIPPFEVWAGIPARRIRKLDLPHHHDNRK